MSDPANIVAAKLAFQLKYAPPRVLREALSADLTEFDGDLIQALIARGHLDVERGRVLRGFAGRFRRAFFEAVFLREVEHRGVTFDEVVDLLVEVEATAHTRSIREVLLTSQRFSVEVLWRAEELTWRRVHAHGQHLTQRYAAESYAGACRPLVPDGTITPDTFRVSRLFRDAAVRDAVFRKLAKLRVPRWDGSKHVEELDLDELDDTDSVAATPFRLPTRTSAKGSAGPGNVPDEIGPYRLLKCLGRGGMGAVYLAQQEDGENVALKVLRPDRASKVDVARFKRETKISRLISHPGVVRLIDSGSTENGLLYMVMPPYECTPLRTLLARNEVAPKWGFSILEQILEALEAIHAANVVHRDLKPGNVLLLAGTGRVKVVDFGIARVFQGDSADTFRTGRGMISGSPAYVAPDTILGIPESPATDLYSLGVLMTEVLAGRPPFQAEGARQYAMQHLEFPPPSLSEIAPDQCWCPELESLVQRLLAKEPEHRPQSARAVLDELRGGLTERSLELLSKGDTDFRRSFEA